MASILPDGWRALEVTGAGLKNDAPTAVWVRVDGKPRELPAHSRVTWAALRAIGHEK